MEYTDGTHGGVLKADDRPKLYTEFHDRRDRLEGGDGIPGARTVTRGLVHHVVGNQAHSQRYGVERTPVALLDPKHSSPKWDLRTDVTFHSEP